MPVKIRELLDKRQQIAKQMRDLVEKAETEKRALDAEEQKSFDAMFAEQDGIKGTLDRQERSEKLDAELNERRAISDPTKPGNAPTVRAIDEATHRYRIDVASIDDDAVRRSIESRGTAEYNQAFREYIRSGSKRSLDASNPANGAFIAAPIQFVQDLIKKMDDITFIRSLATVKPLPNASSLGAPTLEADPADSDWTSELATGSEDTTMAYGQRELKPYPLAKSIKVSNRLIRIAVRDVESDVLTRLAYKFGITQEKAFLTGNGVNQPLGVFTASPSGISTARDISTGNGSTAIAFDGLIAAKFALKAGYLREAVWAFHRDGVKQITQLKDTTNQYLWQPSTQVGQPDRLLGLPVYMSEYVPNTFTTGKYVGMIGAVSFYWIADALDMSVQRLNELYAATNQVGFIARQETDGQPVLEEAFARVTLT